MGWGPLVDELSKLAGQLGLNGRVNILGPTTDVAPLFRSLDAFCLPTDMTMDNSVVEAIPQPWTDAVPYFAAHLAMLELQNYNAAKMYEQLFDKMTLGYSGQARPGRAINQYGRY